MMTEQQFVYWLQGFAELCPDAPTAEQWQSIRDHLATVFKKVTPPVGSPKVDLSGNKDLRDMIEKMRHERVAPQPIPYQPYFLDQGVRPGEIIC